MRLKHCCNLCLLLTLVSVAGAQTSAATTQDQLDIPRSSDPGKRPFLRTFVRDEITMWTSPFRRDSYDSTTMKRYIVPFSIIAAGLVATDRRLTDKIPNSPAQIRWSGRVSQLGAGYTLAGTSGAIYLLGKMTGNKHARESGWLALEAIAHTQLVVFGMKQLTNRERPKQNGGRGGFWQGGDSFPSGHSATSFAMATVFAYEYRDRIAVPIVAYSVASIVAASRLSGRRHWMSDIFVGGSTGFLLGRYVYRHHHDPSLPGARVERGVRSTKWVPEFGIGSRGATAVWNL
jgi:membrane-associated phospholipid phosphatase